MLHNTTAAAVTGKPWTKQQQLYLSLQLHDYHCERANVRLSVGISVCVSIYLCLSVCLSTCLQLCMYVFFCFVFFCLPISLFLVDSLFVCVCLAFYLSLCVHLFTSKYLQQRELNRHIRTLTHTTNTISKAWSTRITRQWIRDEAQSSRLAICIESEWGNQVALFSCMYLALKGLLCYFRSGGRGHWIWRFWETSFLSRNIILLMNLLEKQILKI